jgi:hypothetical protein
MSSYENAPATLLLATHCAVCGRPLVDSVSVETGMGPDCRSKHGYNAEAAPEARAEANKLVYQIALKQGGVEVLQAAVRLRELGFAKLASVLIERKAEVTITEDAAGVVVESPYVPEAVEAFRKVPGRRWDKDAKVNRFPASSKRALMMVLATYYAGRAAIGPKGPFVIEEVA